MPSREKLVSSSHMRSFKEPDTDYNEQFCAEDTLGEHPLMKRVLRTPFIT